MSAHITNQLSLIAFLDALLSDYKYAKVHTFCFMQLFSQLSINVLGLVVRAQLYLRIFNFLSSSFYFTDKLEEQLNYSLITQNLSGKLDILN